MTEDDDDDDGLPPVSFSVKVVIALFEKLESMSLDEEDVDDVDDDDRSVFLDDTEGVGGCQG